MTLLGLRAFAVVYGEGILGMGRTRSVSRKVPKELADYGALPSQLVDIDGEETWRHLGYLDLRSESPGWRRPVVVENNGRPCVHVFDARDGLRSETLAHWCWRIALRGDGAWIGALEP